MLENNKSVLFDSQKYLYAKYTPGTTNNKTIISVRMYWLVPTNIGLKQKKLTRSIAIFEPNNFLSKKNNKIKINIENRIIIILRKIRLLDKL